MYLVLLLLFKHTIAELISQSSISKCYSTNSTNTTCSDKLLVSLTVENAQITTTEYIKITSTTSNNETIQLKTPLIISVTKTPVYANYALLYNTDYNSDPKEVKIAASILSCDDSWSSFNPTCGFQYSNGTKIFDSQGFCCSCGLLDLIGLSDEYARGNVCKAASLDQASMAFCLRYSSLWYSSFTMQSYFLYYNISVQIIYDDNTNQTLNLGSTTKLDSTDGIIARIVGDFTPLQAPPSLESYYLLKPSSPLTDPIVQQGSAAYMFVPKTAVGTGECNKIGVSYSSFRADSNRCSKQVGSCLSNQIADLYQSDLTRISNGSQPQYLIRSQGTFTEITQQNQTYLRYSVQGSMSTMITLEIDTKGKISFVTNLGKAKIDFAEIQDFQAKSGDGILYAQITNIGDISSEFNTFINCSNNVIPLNSESIYLDPLITHTIKKNINVISDSNQTNICNMTLQNNVGDILDYKELTFDTTQLQYTSPQEHDEQQITDKEVDANSTISNQCTSDCGIFLDITCYLSNNCNKQIYTFFAVFGTLLFLLICCCLFSPLRKIIPCSCACRKAKQITPVVLKAEPKMIEESSYFIIESTKLKSLFLNLKMGVDPIPNHIGQDISVEVMVTYSSSVVTKINVKKQSQFVQVFMQVFGDEDVSKKIQKYLDTKRRAYLSFKTTLTSSPLYCVL